MKEAGVDPNQTSTYITNAMMCRPTDTPPKPEAIRSCHGRLSEELEQLDNRQLILALGNSALRSLTGDYNLKITQERGVARDTPFGRVLPTLHPANVLRNPKDYPKFQQDVAYAISLTNGHQPREAGQVRYQVVDQSTLRKAVAFLLKKELLGADIETSGFSQYKNRILCLGVAYAKNRAIIFPEEFIGTPEVKRLLEAEGPKWVWHNGKFDTSFLRRAGIKARVDEDTMLMHYALDEDPGTHDLKSLSYILLGAEKDYEQEVKRYAPKKTDSFAKVPKNVLYKYLAQDCDNTLQLWHILDEQLNQESNYGLPKLYRQLLIPASKFLQGVENNGITVDRNFLRQLDQEFSAEKSRLYQEILQEIHPEWDPFKYAQVQKTATVPIDFNPGSPKQVAHLLYNEYGVRPPKGYPYNTAEATLAAINKTADLPFVDLLLKYRDVNKRLSTYVQGLAKVIQPDGKVHSTYLLHGTVTGRLASRNPNMQNIPREGPIKSLFIASDGHVLVELDYSQAELRVLAHLSGDEFLMTCYQNNMDLHAEVAKHFYGENFTEEQRVRAKFVNFGIAYGRGPQSLAKEFGISVQEASDFISAWYDRAPQAAKYIRKCRSTARKVGGYLVTPFGRRRRFGAATPENINAMENEAANFPIQSTASDLTLIAGMTMVNRLWANYHARIINLVHDSLLVEVPISQDIDSMIQFALGVMEEVPRRVLRTEVPFATEAKYGYAWGSTQKYYPGAGTTIPGRNVRALAGSR